MNERVPVALDHPWILAGHTKSYIKSSQKHRLWLSENAIVLHASRLELNYPQANQWLCCTTWKQNHRKNAESSTVRSMGKNIPFFTMSTSSLTTQLTFLNVVSNTSMKQHNRLINVQMVIWVTSNTSSNLPSSRYVLLSSYKNAGAVQQLHNWIQA